MSQTPRVDRAHRYCLRSGGRGASLRFDSDLNIYSLARKLEKENFELRGALKTAASRFRDPNLGCEWEDAAQECENALGCRDEDWLILHSAKYILEDADPHKLADACGLPLGVITNALSNILDHEVDKND